MTRKYKFCPHCSQPLEDDGSCPNCLYGHKRQQQHIGQAVENRKEHYCEFNDHGQNCTLVGHLSQSTNGSGPWYCRQHFARIMGWPQLEAMTLEKPRSIAVEEIAAGLRPQYSDRLFASLKAKA